jgi:hypothetical protein
MHEGKQARSHKVSRGSADILDYPTNTVVSPPLGILDKLDKELTWLSLVQELGNFLFYFIHYCKLV